jgi:hypothetical protein
LQAPGFQRFQFNPFSFPLDECGLSLAVKHEALEKLTY